MRRREVLGFKKDFFPDDLKWGVKKGNVTTIICQIYDLKCSRVYSTKRLEKNNSQAISGFANKTRSNKPNYSGKST